MARVTIYTDGSCLGNPGRGGYAALLLAGEARKLVSGSSKEERTTNYKMEVAAVFAGLLQLKDAASKIDVVVCTDNEAVATVLSSLDEYRSRDWKKANGNRRIEHAQVWAKLDELVSMFKSFTVKKVAAHSGDVYNDIVDKAARKAAKTGKGEVLVSKPKAAKKDTVNVSDDEISLVLVDNKDKGYVVASFTLPDGTRGRVCKSIKKGMEPFYVWTDGAVVDRDTKYRILAKAGVYNLDTKKFVTL